MLPITKQISNYNHSAPNNVQYIVIHDTGNVTDSAQGNANYFCSADRQSSAHLFVDDNSIYQIVEFTDGSWHCGDGQGKYGITNHNSIGIEMCRVNNTVTATTEANTIELVKYLMSKFNIPTDKVVRHYDASRKNCPSSFSANNWERWTAFKDKLNTQYVAPVGVANKTGLINYKAQVQNVGWQGYVSDGQTAGTEGKELRLEALQIDTALGNLSIQGHVQNVGWQGVKHNNDVVGTVGQSLRLEAIKISIDNPKYSVQYQVHVQDIGWMNWCQDGQVAGTIGQSKRIEAIKIKLVEK